MNRITKISLVLYGSVIALITLDLVLLVSGVDQSHFMAMILLAFFSISISARYIKVLKDQEKEEAISNKNRFKIVKGEV